MTGSHGTCRPGPTTSTSPCTQVSSRSSAAGPASGRLRAAAFRDARRPRPAQPTSTAPRPARVVERHGRVTAVSTFAEGTRTDDVPAVAGDIAKLVGLTDVEIGDQLGRWDPAKGGRHFAPPGLEAVVQRAQPGRSARALRRAARACRAGPADRHPARRDRPGAHRQPLRRGAEGGAGRPAGRRSSASRRSSCPPRPSTSNVSRGVGRGGREVSSSTTPTVGLRVGARPGRLRLRLPAGRRTRLAAALVPYGDRGDARGRAPGGAVWVAGHRLPRDAHPLAVLRTDATGRVLPSAHGARARKALAHARYDGLRAVQRVRGRLPR